MRLCLLLFCLSTFRASSAPLSFERLTPESGLSSSHVTALAQDAQGYLWIGTADGLNRYDGHDCRVFRYHPGDSLGLSGSFIRALSLDGRGQLGVFLGIGGANVHEPLEDRFIHLEFDGAAGSPSPPAVTGILSDEEGHVWVGTRRGLFLRLDPSQRRLFKVSAAGFEGSPGPEVNCLARPQPSRAAVSVRLRMPAGESGSLSIHDTAGRLVREFSLDAGQGALQWDGRDAAGREVASGMYLVRLSAARFEQSGRLIRIR